MKAGPKETLSVRIEPRLLKRLDELCERAGIGRAEMVERCLEVGLDDQEEFVGVLEKPILGEVMHALSHPSVLKAIIPLIFKDKVVDENQMKIRQHMRGKRRGGPAAGKLAAE